MRTLKELEAKGRRVLVRVDFNVPLTPEGKVRDALRIEESLPTLRRLKEQGARTILMSHLGRPKKPDPALSLRPVAEKLGELLGTNVAFVTSCVGEAARTAATAVKDGEFLLLENLRFDPREEANEEGFAQELARLGEVFVEDAFGTVHRAHASTVGVPKLLPSYAGFLVEREVRELTQLTEAPRHPYVALIGGMKIDTKLPLLKNLMHGIDRLLIGGALGANIVAQTSGNGGPMGDVVADLLAMAKKAEVEVVLPSDFLLQEDSSGKVMTSGGPTVPPGFRAMDIGPATRELFCHRLSDAETVFVNGPLGKAEDSNFAEGSRQVFSEIGRRPRVSIVAGGDTAGIVRSMGLVSAFSYLSTGGGAALEFIEGRTLPGLAVLP
ncbi:MAG: phosphoglycerate kinase [Candidatus Thermoplasmatota archaeon]|jgi:3-phosphoglycerate kinase|nr:phosphoglycerate kinase [Candidatus Thermoplasmatota archaeon]MCL5984812.1 phosphoglycerate kinase [Candidatus Thermoplasmatota archaeon]